MTFHLHRIVRRVQTSPIRLATPMSRPHFPVPIVRWPPMPMTRLDLLRSWPWVGKWQLGLKDMLPGETVTIFPAGERNAF